MRKVEWLEECDGGKYPFCPYCNEFAYEKDHCVFCGKKYKWVEKGRKARMVTVGEYTVVQASNNHITITKGDRMVYHASCTKRMSKRKLRKHVDFYEELIATDTNDGRKGEEDQT